MSKMARQHGVKGVYYGGDWVDIEDCDGTFNVSESSCSGCHVKDSCPRSKSRNDASKSKQQTSSNVNGGLTSSVPSYDVIIIGAGCIGASIARELSKYSSSVLWLEAADDVSQGATKGNSGIVHAGYDDKPGTNRAKYCWKGNQMFAALDRELRFGYQKNGSLVLAFNEDEVKVLHDLKKRGETNGVQRLKIVNQEELRKLEPHVNEKAVAALYAPDAGNVIPYEFAIALAENAVDNGVELRIRREVTNIQPQSSPSSNRNNNSKNNGNSQSSAEGFIVTTRYWEPAEYVSAVQAREKRPTDSLAIPAAVVAALALAAHLMFNSDKYNGLQSLLSNPRYFPLTVAVAVILFLQCLLVFIKLVKKVQTSNVTKDVVQLATQAGKPQGKGESHKVSVSDMLTGGSGSRTVMHGITMATETYQATYVINCAGGYSDVIAQMVEQNQTTKSSSSKSFKIKPRIGDYLLLNRNQGHLAKQTLFPCPHPVLGKGVLVQTTLWGNLILGPTARDMHKEEARTMTSAEVQRYILSKCKQLVPSFDPKEVFHAFAGARSKSTRGDWIVERSEAHGSLIHVAGIDSPGLAGAPAIALDVMQLLQEAGLSLKKNPKFNPNRAPLITPKAGMKGLKMGPLGKNDAKDLPGNDLSKKEDVARMASNVICKCEKVTELEVVRACRRSLPIDSSQAIRKRTRAGMGHCQGDAENYGCEARVRAIVARENGVPVEYVGARPWPATSTLSQRWIDEEEKEELVERMKA